MEFGVWTLGHDYHLYHAEQVTLLNFNFCVYKNMCNVRLAIVPQNLNLNLNEIIHV